MVCSHTHKYIYWTFFSFEWRRPIMELNSVFAFNLGDLGLFPDTVQIRWFNIFTLQIVALCVA